MRLRALERDQVVLVADAAIGDAPVVQHHPPAPVADAARAAVEVDAPITVVDDQDVVAVAAGEPGVLEDLAAAARIEQALDLKAGGVAVALVGDALDHRLGPDVLGRQFGQRIVVQRVGQPLGNRSHGQRVTGRACGDAVGAHGGHAGGVLARHRQRPDLVGDDRTVQRQVDFLERPRRGRAAGRAEVGLLAEAAIGGCRRRQRDGGLGGAVAPVTEGDRCDLRLRTQVGRRFGDVAALVEDATVVADDGAADEGVAEQRHVAVEGLVELVEAAGIEEHVDAAGAGVGVVAQAAVQRVGKVRAGQAVVAGFAQDVQGQQVGVHAGGVDHIVTGAGTNRQHVAAAEAGLTAHQRHAGRAAHRVLQRDQQPVAQHVDLTDHAARHGGQADRGHGKGVGTGVEVAKGRDLAAVDRDAVVGAVAADVGDLQQRGGRHLVGLGHLRRERRGVGRPRRDQHRGAAAAGRVVGVGIHQRPQARGDAGQAGIGRGHERKVLGADADAPGGRAVGRCGAGQGGRHVAGPELLEHLGGRGLDLRLAAARPVGVAGLVDRGVGQGEAAAAALGAERDLGAAALGHVLAALVDPGDERRGQGVERVVAGTASVDRVLVAVDRHLPAAAGHHGAGQCQLRLLFDALALVLGAGQRAGLDAGVAVGVGGRARHHLLADAAVGRHHVARHHLLDLGRARGHAGVEYHAADQRALEVVDRDHVGAGAGVDLDALDAGAVQRQAVEQHLHAGAQAGQGGAAHRVGHAGAASDAAEGDVVGAGGSGDGEHVDITAAALDHGVQAIAHRPQEAVGTGTAGQDVDIQAAGEHVDASAAEQGVLAFLARQRIVAIAAVQAVVTHAAVEPVVVAITGQAVVALVARQGIGAGAAGQVVRTFAARQHVVIGAAAEQVVALHAGELVLAVTAIQLVAQVAAHQRVVAGVAIELSQAVAAVGADQHAVVARAAVQHHVDGRADGAVDDDLVVIRGTVGCQARHVAQAEVVLGAARGHLDVLLIGTVRAGGQLDLADQETLASGLAALVLRRHAQMQGAAAERGQLRRQVFGAGKREVVQHRREEGLARAEDGDLGAEDLHPDPEVGIQPDRDVAIDRENALRVFQQLFEVNPAVVFRQDKLVRVVVYEQAGAGVRVVLEVEVDGGLDVALHAHLDQATDAQAGAGEDPGRQRGFRRVVARTLDAVVIEEEAAREDERDVGRLVAAGLELDEAARRQTQRDVGGGGDLAAELGVQAREDREHLFVQELQVQRRHVVLEQGHFLAHQQAQHVRRAGEQGELPGARLGADLGHHVLGRRCHLAAEVERRRRARRGVGVVLVARIATDDEIAEVDQQRLAGVVLDEVVDRLDELDHLDDRPHRLHHAGVLGLAQHRAGQVKQRLLRRFQLDEQRDLGSQDLGQRLQRPGDLAHLIDDGRHETGDELAQVQRHVLEHDQRRAAEAGARHARAEGGLGEHLVVVQRGVDAGEVEDLAAAQLDGLHRQRGLEVDIGHCGELGHHVQAFRHRRAQEGRLVDRVAAVAARVGQVDGELAIKAAGPAIHHVLQLAVEEHHLGAERGARRHRGRQVDLQLVATGRDATGVEVETVGLAQAEAQAQHVVEAQVDGVVGPGAERETGDGDRKVDGDRHRVLGRVVLQQVDRAVVVVREDVLEDAVAQRDVEAQAGRVDGQLDFVGRFDRPQLGRAGGAVVDRVAVGALQWHAKHIEARLAQGLVQLGVDQVDDQVGHRHVIGRVGVAVLGHRIGQHGAQAAAAVTGLRKHRGIALAAGHAQKRVSQRVDELGAVLELVANQRQRQRGELRLQPGLDAAEHAVQALQHRGRVVEQREDVDAGHQRRHHHRKLGADAPAHRGIELAADVQHVVADAVTVAVARGTTERERQARKVQRQIGLGIAAEVDLERATELVEVIAAVTAAVVLQAEAHRQVQAGAAVAHIHADFAHHRHIQRGLQRQRRAVAHIQAQLQARAVLEEQVGRQHIAQVEAHAEVEVGTRQHGERAAGFEVQPQRAGDLGQRGVQLGQVDRQRHLGGVGQAEVELEVEGRVLVFQRDRLGRLQPEFLEQRHQARVDLGL